MFVPQLTKVFTDCILVSAYREGGPHSFKHIINLADIRARSILTMQQEVALEMANGETFVFAFENDASKTSFLSLLNWAVFFTVPNL